MTFAREFFYNDLQSLQPRILASACLLGDRVRYDGQDKSFPGIAEFFAQHAEVSRICPEIGAGFSVPRPPVALQQTDTGIRALGVEDKSLDVTAALAEYSQKFIRQQDKPFHAAILKSRSPSCGFGTTPVYGHGSEPRQGNGIFAQALHRQWPCCIISDEMQLATTIGCRELLFRCYILLDREITPGGQLSLWMQHYKKLFGMDWTLDHLLRDNSRHFCPA